MKKPNYFILLILLIVFNNCEKENYVPGNELIIYASIYNNNNLPVTTNDFHLQILRMDNPRNLNNDEIFENLYYDNVESDHIIFTPDNGLKYGRYVIHANKNNYSASSEIIYKGGSITINLILK